ncbi:membrane protein insertase YidC [Actinobacillus delphinicola]|uniref:Membrane protein insertase YidC n=1 Tax=Actinobacillus delphinicola TaxID=51161 RepID=A0A448TUP6_9PAST|nr:membrane protein insertase YidC [Actinobacillus delphinicola]VEJ09561.1 putative inner membrane protein translocase component YidC [Actinobacillus delphinicola]
MNSRRSLFLLALLFLSFLIYQEWNVDYHSPKPVETAKTQTSENVPAASSSVNTVADLAAPATQQGRIITLENDVFRLKVDTLGGDIVDAQLLKYSQTLHSKQPFTLLQDNNKEIYIAQSGLIGKNGSDNVNGRALYQVNGDNFKLMPGQQELRVPFTFTKDGVTYTKTFVLKPNQYVVGVDYNIANHTDHAIEVEPYAQLKHTLVESKSTFVMPTYTGGAYSSSETNYKKYSFKDMQESNLAVNTKVGWVAMLQHYFVSAWIPPQDQNNELYTFTNEKENVGIIGFRGQMVTIPAGGDKVINTKLWTGPKLQDQMEKVANHLELTLDYGWAWFISKPLFSLLNFIHSLVKNWGIAIIIVTIIVKALLYPLTRAQYTSMAKMRMLQPRIQEMRERFGDDKQSMSQEMMRLYREEKVNPLGGCLPIFLQMPILIALYYMFMEAVELRHAPFFGWIQDLAAPDPYYILPILMGVSMFFLQKMSPTPTTDPTQQKIMTYMPVVFTVFFLFFPAGLVLYWLVSNLITITQQQIIYRELEKKGLHTRKKKAK